MAAILSPLYLSSPPPLSHLLSCRRLPSPLSEQAWWAWASWRAAAVEVGAATQARRVANGGGERGA